MTFFTRTTLSLLIILLVAGPLAAQQDALFSKYRFNSLTFNPAYAGSNEHLTLNLLHRQQWMGLEGAPRTQTLTAHTPLANDRVGLGLSLTNDKIGASGTFDLSTAYAYRVPVGERFRLAGGLQLGVTQWRGDWTKLTLDKTDDPAFVNNLNRWLPNFGAGLYLYSDRFYLGFACPRLLEHDLRRTDSAEDGAFFARTYRHYYTTIGGAFPWQGNENLIVRPSLLLKSTGLFSGLRSDEAFQSVGSPTQVDVDVSLLFMQIFWAGASYRTALERGRSSDDSADLWAAVLLRNGLRLGAAYDVVLSPLRSATSGSFELMLGYEFDIKTNRVASPRYF
jgi:type IX secretion system PorP/SprF family membrane protein